MIEQETSVTFKLRFLNEKYTMTVAIDKHR